MRWLILTTHDDRCESYFTAAGHEVRYYESLAALPEVVDVVYFRDPFNAGQYNMTAIGQTMQQVCERYPDAYYVDGCMTIDDALIEDKWRQYSQLARFMPATQLATDVSESQEKVIIKERISSRARGISFALTDIPPARRDAYIVQPLLDIIEEYRVYTVRGRVAPYMTQKSPKTADSKVKVIGAMPTDDAMKQYVEAIVRHVPREYDLLGFDIARTTDGLTLIELNRSPQFKRYNELTGTNILETTITAIEEKQA